MFLTIPHDPTLKAVEDQKLGGKDLNGFSVLINGDIAQVNRRLRRLGSQRNDFDDLTLNMQGVPGRVGFGHSTCAPYPTVPVAKGRPLVTWIYRSSMLRCGRHPWHQVF